MYSSLDKALVGVVMGVLYVLNSVFHINVGLNETAVSSIIAAVTPILIYLIPNKPK